MANFDDLFTTPTATETQSDRPQLTKEEYAAKKKAERDSLYALADEMAQEVMRDGEAFRGFLDVQARFDRYSATNALLIYAQNDEATRLRDFDGWKERGIYVRKNETGISILEAGDSYVTEDGRTGYYYNVKKVFDISQTDAKRQRQPQVHYDDRLLLSALIAKRPVPIEMADSVQNGAVYDYDELEMSGSRAVWPEVLAVYAVKTTTDPDDPQEVATVDDSKKVILKDIFWQMNEISSRTESKTEEVIAETDDGHGNIVETATTVTRTYLYITVGHKTAEEMADRFNFTDNQRQQLSELLAEENRRLWSAVLYGIYSGDDAIVTVALSQVGNAGGQPYWSWYGFDSRVEWCACFVSWCANECGYIDSGVCPKFSGCGNGVQWFQERGQWLDGSAKPVPGMVIFFDWDNKGGSGPQDGETDHVGIVQKVEDGIIYTVEGNSGNLCRVNRYPIGHYEILGYGVLCP